MKERVIRVRLEGDVKILVPDHVSDADADILAEKLALAKVIATTDNPDGPDEDALYEYMQEASGNARVDDWDKSSCETIGGAWTIVPNEERSRDPLSDFGWELPGGGAICFPEDNGDIRRIDDHGNTEEIRAIGDADWHEWRDLFPDDALYFQPERAGDPDCGNSAADISSFHVYRDRENAEKAHPDCDILGYTFLDIEKPAFLDVENPTYHDKGNDPASDTE